MTRVAIINVLTRENDFIELESFPTSTPGLCITGDTTNELWYCLTHIQSGCKVGPRVKSMKKARELASGLKELDWTGDPTGEHRVLLMKVLKKVKK